MKEVQTVLPWRLPRNSKIVFSVLGCLILVSAGQAEAQDLSKLRSSGKVRIGFSTLSPGFLYEEGIGLTGFATELVGLIAKELKIKNVDWKKVSTPDGLYKELDRKSVDAIVDAKLAQPRYNVNITSPLACTGGVILSRPGGPTQEAQLKGMRIAVAEKTQYAYYARNLPFQKNVVVFGAPDQALLAFLGGSVDVIVLDRMEALTMYKKVGASKLQVSPVIWNESIHMTMPHTSDAFMAGVDSALAKMLSSGAYARLSKKYFVEDVRCAE